VAEALKLRFEEIPGLRCALMATDIAPGEDWEQRIRTAARDCDAIACLVTPEYIRRPWFYAEWAVFWFEDKTWYLLMLETSLQDVFEVMRKRQTSFLDDRRSVEHLLTHLAAGTEPVRGFDLLAAETVRAVAQARTRQAAARAEADLAQLSVLLQAGEDNVAAPLVDRLLAAGRLDELVVRALNPSSSGPTKRRQLGMLLVQRGYAAAAAKFDDLIYNNAERRTVGIACLDRLALDDTDDDALSLVLKIYRAVRDPQRQNLRSHAERLGLSISWPEVPPNP
jgi:hypothetical protein